MAPKKFKLKPKPIKPVLRKGISKKESIMYDSGASLLATLEGIRDRGIDLARVQVAVETCPGYYGDVEVTAELWYNEDETQEEYDKRLEVYKKKKVIYDNWAKRNKKALAKRLKEDAEEEAEKKAKQEAIEIANLEKRLNKLKKDKKS